MLEKQTKKALEQQIKELQRQNVELKQKVELLENKAKEVKGHDSGSNNQQSQFIQNVLETFPYPAYFRDTHGRFQAGNSAWIDIVVGWPLNEIANKTMPQLTEDAQNSFLGKNYEQDLDLIQSGDTINTYESVNCPDNIEREFFIQKSVVRDKKGKAEGIIGLMIEKSDLDLAQLLSQKNKKSMGNSRNILQDILYSLPYGIMIVDAETHTILDVNPQTMVLIGKSLDQIVGKPCHSFIQKENSGSCPLLEQEETLLYDETSLITNENKTIPILRTVLKTTIADRACLVESFIDITESKKAEALRTEQERMQSMFELAGAVCHELNQPLMIISGYAELLEQVIDNHDQNWAHINKIKNQVTRMGDITKKLMRITKYETKDYLDGKIIDINSAAA